MIKDMQTILPEKWLNSAKDKKPQRTLKHKRCSAVPKIKHAKSHWTILKIK